MSRQIVRICPVLLATLVPKPDPKSYINCSICSIIHFPKICAASSDAFATTSSKPKKRSGSLGTSLPWNKIPRLGQELRVLVCYKGLHKDSRGVDRDCYRYYEPPTSENGELNGNNFENEGLGFRGFWGFMYGRQKIWITPTPIIRAWLKPHVPLKLRSEP